MPYKDPEKDKEYKRAWHKARQVAAREWANKDKTSKGCSVCGYNKNPQALHYHHHNGDKEYSVAKLVAMGKTMERVVAEASKCVVLCANCHADVHSSPADGPGSARITTFHHGRNRGRKTV